MIIIIIKYNTELEHEIMIIEVSKKNLSDKGFKLLSEIKLNLVNNV